MIAVQLNNTCNERNTDKQVTWQTGIWIGVPRNALICRAWSKGRIIGMYKHVSCTYQAHHELESVLINVYCDDVHEINICDPARLCLAARCSYTIMCL